MTNFLMVDVASVTSSIPRSSFNEANLDILADMILESGGILKPLVLKKTGFEKYEVVEGHFEYYAAVRAREKNPSEGEMVNALIFTPEEEEAVLKQVAIFKEQIPPDKSITTIPETTNTDSSRLANLELRLEKQINELKSELTQERQKLEAKLKQIEDQIPTKISPLQVFNTLSTPELVLRLRSAALTDEKATKIAECIEKERKKKLFASLKDVVTRVKITSGKKQIKGITSDKMIDIVDSWSQVLFR
jgi:hypothetical protein